MRPTSIAQPIFLAALLFAGWFAGAGRAGTMDETNVSTPALRAEEAYHRFQARHEAEPTNLEVAWRFASACFDECEFARNDADRARVANEGIAVCRAALAADAKLAAAHYYLAMDLAELARTELLGALGLLSEMEKEWNTTIALDENFDYAGADRNLGVLYRDAPGWPVSLGNRNKARQHLRRAVALHPEYPENHLSLIEAYLDWGDRAEGRAEAEALGKILDGARKKFSGPAWESAWVDWNKRWVTIQNKLNQYDIGQPHRRK